MALLRQSILKSSVDHDTKEGWPFTSSRLVASHLALDECSFFELFAADTVGGSPHLGGCQLIPADVALCVPPGFLPEPRVQLGALRAIFTCSPAT